MWTGPPKLTHARYAGGQDGCFQPAIRCSSHTSDPGAKAEPHDRASAHLDLRPSGKIVYAAPYADDCPDKSTLICVRSRKVGKRACLGKIDQRRGNSDFREKTSLSQKSVAILAASMKEKRKGK